ncbi:hypothetical protein OH77DRAFT_1389445 [Trametes cingulata]|nr:hypothetical protein OH77DRAFT_1389445 [Trametes cingulata]
MTSDEGWKVSVSQDWDVLGPFPIHAREQHFLSPSFPLDLAEPIDFNATYPSAYADGGLVGWTKARAEADGTLAVSFPNIRWESLRATEGWAAFQHHSVLRSTLTVYPPTQAQKPSANPPRLLVNLIQGSFFTILPVNVEDLSTPALVPEWHAGNIYGMSRSPPNSVVLQIPPSITSPTTYSIFVSGDYEIRLFGDPRHSGGGVPTLSMSLTVGIEEPTLTVTRDSSHDVFPDFVDGWAFGDALGVGLRSVDGWWTVEHVAVSEEVAGSMLLELLEPTRLAPTQTRIVPLKLTQTRRVDMEKFTFTLTIRSDDATATIDVVLPIWNQDFWAATDHHERAYVKTTYFFRTSTPTAFLAAPPNEPNDGPPKPPVLALHGAGVDLFESDFWIQAIPRQQHSWIITPTGRTPWGMDWHGPSAQDAWGTVDALHKLLNTHGLWRRYAIAPNSKVLLMGHSNGGQGAWYLAARYPDRVVGVIPAAGYIKSQSYVPWVQSAHYIDPALRAILDSSLTPDDNDLFLSNLVDTPILAIHGGDDDNVPVWHTREAVSVLKTWNPSANVTFREDPGEPHWYSSVFANDQVRSFISAVLEGSRSSSEKQPASRSFTLTVAVPSDSGSLHGWSVHRLNVPGRLGRLSVQIGQDAIRVRTSNVKAFSIHIGSLPSEAHSKPFLFDGQRVELDAETWNLSDFSLYLATEGGQWTVGAYSPGEIRVDPRSGRMATVLTSAGPLVIVIPTRQPSLELSAALRLAHNLNVYHKLDAEILDDQEASQRLLEASSFPGNVVVIGLGAFARSVLREGKTVLGVRDQTLELRGRLLNESSMAALLLHPHPSRTTASLLFIYGADSAGLERALRLFPIRTGITVPDWIVVGSHADDRGSGGVEGAGVWGNDWGWNEAMSAF